MKKIVALILVLALLIALGARERCVPMGIEFDGTNDQILYPYTETIAGLSAMTIISQITIDTIPNDSTRRPIVRRQDNAQVNTAWELALVDAADGDVIAFVLNYSGGGGDKTSAANITVGRRFVAVTTDFSSANKHKLYIDGAEVTYLTEETNTGTRYSEASPAGTSVGSNFAVTQVIDGTLHSVLIYNRILSAQEILDAYNSKLAIPTTRGLVFAPHLCGAAGLQTFDGATLGGTNYIIDQISGAQGTPSGSPIGRADTYLTFDN